MEPRIQYAQTADGVSIAFWTLGEGMPLVQMPAMLSHSQLEWQWPDARRWYERLAEEEEASPVRRQRHRPFGARR